MTVSGDSHFKIEESMDNSKNSSTKDKLLLAANAFWCIYEQFG
jgi:hypothetical protein